MKNTSASVIAAATLAVGATFGYFVPRAAETPPDSERTAEGSKGTEAAELRAEVKRLRKALSERAKPAEKVRGDADAANVDVSSEVRVVSSSEDESKVKATLGKMLRNATVETESDKSVGLLQDMDTDWMTKEELAVHSKLIDLNKRKAEMDRQMMESILNKDKEGSPKMSIQERMKLEYDIGEACEKERNSLLRRTADVLGYSGDDANAFIDTVNDIYKATTPSRGGVASTRITVVGDDGMALPGKKVEKSASKSSANG